MKKLYSLFTGLLVMASLTATAAGEGTLESPYSASQALEIILSGDIPADEVYVEGIVSSIKDISIAYGNATYYISDDGTTENQFYIYRGYYLDKEKFTSVYQLKTGDKVVVVGKLINYNSSSPQMTQGNYICSIERTETPDDPGTSTLENPYTVSEALEMIVQGAIPAGEVYVAGIVSGIKDIDTDTYGNASYYISDDGAAENQLLIYRGYYLDNEKFTSEDQLQEDDKVVICGLLLYYNNTQPEMTQGNYICSIERPVDPDAPLPGTGEGTLESPYDATRAVAVILSGDIPEEKVYVEGVVTSIRDISVDYGNATYYISDTGLEETQLLIYRGHYLNDEKFTSEDQLQEGYNVVIYGQLVNYNGTPEMAMGNYLSSVITFDPVDEPDLEAVTYLIGNFNDWLSTHPATPVDGVCRWEEVVLEVDNSVNAFNFTQATAVEIEASDWLAMNDSRISPAEADSGTVYVELDTPMAAVWRVDAAWIIPEGTYDLELDLKALTLTVSVNESGTALDTVEAASASRATYYTLTGVSVAEPAAGMYVKVQDGLATKVVR